jgi:hypothetical protein
MFEYLMPSLVLRAPQGSMLADTNRRIVARQIAHGVALGIPWGVSESGYNARDLEMTYQYSNFGVPDLGLKRGLSVNRVVAPYATGLAAMVDPAGARHNYAVLAGLGAEGTARLITFLRDLKAEAPILLVEHDMDAVFRLADQISTLVFGKVIATGTAQEIKDNPEVKQAYLGDEVAEVATH